MFSVYERRRAAVEALSASVWFQMQPSGQREEVGAEVKSADAQHATELERFLQSPQAQVPIKE